MSFKNRRNRKQSNSSEGTQTTTGFKPSPLGAAVLRGVIFAVCVGIAFLIILNMQPWVEVAEAAAKEIKVIPFQDALTAIPFIGGVILWVIVNLAKILAVTLWAIVNGIEQLPALLKASGRGTIPKDAMKFLNLARAVAYVAEITVCWVRYPSYQGGFAAVAMDWPNLQMDLIDWQQLSVFLLAVIGCEICLRTGIALWSIGNSLKSASSVQTT
jgi:hypothetical protein